MVSAVVSVISVKCTASPCENGRRRERGGGGRETNENAVIIGAQPRTICECSEP